MKRIGSIVLKNLPIEYRSIYVVKFDNITVHLIKGEGISTIYLCEVWFGAFNQFVY